MPIADGGFVETLENLRLLNVEWARTSKLLRNDPLVPATHAKAIFCGKAHVGKTTLRQTLEKTAKKSLQQWLTGQLTQLLSCHKKVKPTRGIEVLHIHGGTYNVGKSERQLVIWDLARQWEFEILHSSFVLDIGLADGPGTSFVIVCSENMPIFNGDSSNIQSKKHEKKSTSNFISTTNDLLYWLRFIASHSSTGIEAAMEWGLENGGKTMWHLEEDHKG